jgi:hypothetical protein
MSKVYGITTTGNNNTTNRWAVTSTVYTNATDTVEVASTVDNNSGVDHAEHSDLKG